MQPLPWVPPCRYTHTFLPPCGRFPSAPPQMCQKQCRDENGFKCHLSSEGHKRQMEIFGQNPHRIVEGCAPATAPALPGAIQTLAAGMLLPACSGGACLEYSFPPSCRNSPPCSPLLTLVWSPSLPPSLSPPAATRRSLRRRSWST